MLEGFKYPSGIPSHDAFYVNQMCTRKKKFKSEGEAAQDGCRVYRCPICGLFHRSTSREHKQTM